MLLLARGAGTPRRRILHALPALANGGALPAGPRSGAGHSRPIARLLRGLPMSELKNFKLPDVGEGLTEADIVRWHVQPGDEIKINQIIVEIETAKAVVELPSPYAGIVADLLVPEGATADVGTPIISVQVGGG